MSMRVNYLLSPKARIGHRSVHSVFRRTAISIGVGVMLGGALAAYAGQPGQILSNGILRNLPAGTLPISVIPNGPADPVSKQLPNIASSGNGNATAQQNGSTLTINQTSQKVIIDWNSFNISSDGVVNFVQPNAGASALNKILDANPSIIQGKITANGQIILLNQNGILFDSGSQVNARSLIASTISITDDVFKNGASSSLGAGALQFDGVTGFTKIEVASGATLTSAAGGNIILLAPNVVNNGIIQSPDGQVILAAGKSVLLFQPPDQNSAQMRGYFVQVTADKDPLNLTSLVTNLGTISADRGNVTLAGLVVNQMNRVSAKTAVNANGSIYLIGQDTTVLGKGSVTETPLDTSDTTTLSEGQNYSAFRAAIKVEGNTILQQGTIVSPSGNVSFSTLPGAVLDLAHSSSVTATGGAPNSGPTRIFLDQGSVIDVSGDWVDLPLSKSLITFRVTSNDLKDDPLQKGGILLGQTVTVNAIQGSPLFDISGYAATIPRTVAEKATTGGSISLLSGGDLVVQSGALLDASGGGYRFATGAVPTTQLLSNGKLYDIGSASPDIRYDAVLSTAGYTVKHSKWGVTETFPTLLSQLVSRQPGYVQGQAAGSITLDGSSMILNGTLRASVTEGRYQIANGTLPAAGALTIGIADPNRTPIYLLNGITFTATPAALASNFNPLTDALPPDQTGTLQLAVGAISKPAVVTGDSYVQQGFGSISASANNLIDLPASLGLELAPGASLALTAGQIKIGGSVSAPGGSVTLKALGTSVELGTGASITTAGLWINDRLDALPGGTQALVPHIVQGGKINLSSANTVTLASGSLLDASGGADFTAKGTLLAGNAGSITLQAGSGPDDDFVGSLNLSGQLRGYSASKGGSLSVSAPRVVIGATAPDAATLALAPDFFQTGGFTNYSVAGFYSVTLAPGAAIAPVANAYVVDIGGAALVRTGADLGSISTVTRQPVWQRQATSLSLKVNGSQPVAGAGLLIGEGASIVTDPGASISLTSLSSLDVLGTLSAPAGSISMTVTKPVQLNALPLHLGSNARLLAQGYFLPQQNNQNLQLGQILSGGKITLSGDGDIVADAGSVIDVSGVSAQAQVPVASNRGTLYQTTLLNGDAGSIVVTSSGSVSLASDIRGHADGTAAGGSFALSLLGGNVSGTPQRRIVISANGPATSSGTIDAVFDPVAWNRSGFDKLYLSSTDLIEFDGNPAIAAARSIELSAPVLNVAGGNATLSSAQVRIDGPSTDPDNAIKIFNHETVRGTGTLTVNAGQIDLVGGITVNGVSRVTLNSAGDVRATGIPVRVGAVNRPDQVGVPDSLIGYLATPGDIQITAQQIYPTTLSQFSFAVADVVQSSGDPIRSPVAGGRIDISRAGGTPGSVLAAGGTLTLSADAIAIAGTVKAPLGRIDINGRSSVTLAAGSLLSVSAGGLIVPFGETVNGQNWNYGAIQNVSLPAKNISVNAPNVAVNTGAVLDVSGGGDVQAVEWIPGIGGSSDVLLAANTYAILPSLRLAYAPLDTDLLSKATLPFNTPGGVYNAVYFPGGNGIAAGYYPLLPGYYALLPGAYQVTLQTGSAFANILPGQRITLSDGTAVMAGKFAVSGTGIQAQTWSAFSLQSIAQVQREAEYTLSNSSFFARLAATNGAVVPPLPQDAGRVSIAATSDLVFAPTLLGTPGAGGNGAQVDISAPDITVVANAGASSGGAGVQLDAQNLSSLNASLLLGGTRSDGSGGSTLSVGANSVTIGTGAVLSGPEIILAATGTIDVQSGAVIKGQGSFSGTAKDLQVADANGNGALLRVSSGNQVNVTRTGSVDRSQGTLTVESGAQVLAARSMILDSTKSTQSFGSLTVADGGFVSLGAGNIRVGNAPASADSLLIGTAELEGFSRLDTIALRSYTSIDFYGDVSLGSTAFNRISLDASAINGIGGGTATVQARNVTLQNTSGTNSAAATGAGTIGITADSVTLGGGSKAISGFNTVTITATGDIVGADSGDLRAAGNLTLVSSRVTGAKNSNQAIAAVDDSQATKTYYTVTLQQPATPLVAADTPALGAKLAITGSSIDHSGDIELPSGSLTLTATGPGGITLHDGSHIFAGGIARMFGPSAGLSPAGTVSLVAMQGNVVATALSSIDVSGSALGGDAGTFSLTTSGALATVQLDGVLNGAAESGYRQGSAVLDLASAQNFSILNAKLNQGGFSESRNIRVRTGDVTVAGPDAAAQSAGDVFVARTFKLSADQGSITVGGTIDASASTGGGKIELDAMNDVNLVGGSLLMARGTSAASGVADAYSNGGSIRISSRTGTLNMAAGAIVDVSANATGKSNGGTVTFSARRTTDGTGVDADVAMNLAGRVNVGGGANGGLAGSATIVGVHAYDGITDTVVASAPGSVMMTDYQSFVGNSAAIVARLNGQGFKVFDKDLEVSAQVSGGIELRSNTDMLVSSAWDLTTPSWMPSAVAGQLTLLAAGNLTIQAALGFPDDNLVAANSWSLRLVGGADLNAADTSAVQSLAALGNSGDVVLVNAGGAQVAKIRTGNGSIDIAAGRNIVIQDPPGTAPTNAGDSILTVPAAVIYTAGLPGADGGTGSLYATGGGNISLTAQGSITGAALQQQWVNDWLRRTTASPGGNLAGRPASWWVNRSSFRNNIGTLGGGNVSVSAGGDVTNLSIMLPTTGRVFTSAPGQPVALDVEGGGNLAMQVGGNLVGGNFLVARGVGTIDVAGSVGAGAPIALYLMGQGSSAGGPAGAQVYVRAGGDLNLQNVSNPTVLPLSSPATNSTAPGFQTLRSAFFTYDASDQVQLSSLAGDISYAGLASPILSKVRGVTQTLGTNWSDMAPPNFEAVAYQGSITGTFVDPTQPPAFLYPSANGSLQLLAQNGISNVAFQVVDVIPSSQPNWGWDKAFSVNTERPLDTSALHFGSALPNRFVTPGPSGKYDFVVDAASGSIVDSALTLPRQAYISAGTDIIDLRLDGQNLSADDVTVFRAGRDIRYVPTFTSDAIDSQFHGGYIRMGGPGRLLVQAGGNIDLGTSEGITAGGANYNLSLTSTQSAQLAVIAGVTGDMSSASVDQLFTDLKVAGVGRDVAAGEAAIEKAFADVTVGKGDITMFFSAIQTLGGSGIDLLVPNGNINAGLPTPAGGNIGIFTTFGGGIRTYLSGNFNVNQSKVMTLDGGDILLYSSDGSIDAGRGARDSVTTQPPQRVAILDDNGQPTGLFTFIPPSDASGSGIRSLTFDPDGPGPLKTPKPGDIFLFAPKGFIDAGEAGVSSAGNIFVAALQVLNASNFSAGGTSVGVPVAVNTGISAGLSGASSVGASAAKSAEDITKSLTTAAATVPKDIYRPSFISVEVLGVGEDSSQKDDKDKK
jgi:filamentous hemagglutinin family protein